MTAQVFVKVLKSIIFIVKSFLGIFRVKEIWAGNTGIRRGWVVGGWGGVGQKIVFVIFDPLSSVNVAQ